MSLDMLTVIFNEDERVCVGYSTFDTEVTPLASAPAGVFLSINPLIERRRDANVTVYRNILIEFDSIPLERQRKYVEEIGMPFTSCVFSGKKSYHFILSLETPLANRGEYDAMVRRIHSVVKVADKATKNPSRFTRYPGTIRPDTGKRQELVELRTRIPNADLERWLKANGSDSTPAVPNTVTVPRNNYGNFTSLRRSTIEFLTRGAAEGHRNSSVFKAACDMTRCGFTRKSIQLLINKRLPLNSEWIQTIDNAIHTVRHEVKILTGREPEPERVEPEKVEPRPVLSSVLSPKPPSITPFEFAYDDDDDDYEDDDEDNEEDRRRSDYDDDEFEE